MKVFLLISSYSDKPGGHFYTVLSYYKALSKIVDCTVVAVGRVPPSIYTHLEDKSKFYELRSVLGSVRSLRELVKDIRGSTPTVLHSFDVLSHWVADWLSNKLDIGHVHTKCGGPSPTGYYPECHDILLFSKENMEWFLRSPKHKQSRLKLLPNRVVREPVNQERVEWFRATHLKPDRLHLLLIARFVRLKKRQFLAVKTLTERLRQYGVPYQATVIGVVQEQDFFEEVKDWGMQDTQLLTSPDVTTHASDFIPCTDVIIATGRSVMEASAQGAIIALPSQDDSVVLLNEDTLEQAASYNFSVRGTYPNWTTEMTVSTILELLGDKDKALAFRGMMETMYQNHFDLEKRVDELIDVYRQSKPSTCRLSCNALRMRFYLVRKLLFGI